MLRFWLRTRERFRLWKFILQPESRLPCVSRPGRPVSNHKALCGLILGSGVFAPVRRVTPVSDGGTGHLCSLQTWDNLSTSRQPVSCWGLIKAPATRSRPARCPVCEAPAIRVGTLPSAAHRGNGAAVPTASEELPPAARTPGPSTVQLIPETPSQRRLGRRLTKRPVRGPARLTQEGHHHRATVTGASEGGVAGRPARWSKPERAGRASTAP